MWPHGWSTWSASSSLWFSITFMPTAMHTLKNFSLILDGQDYRLAPAYDLINTGLHVDGDDFGLDGGLSPDMEKSDVFERTRHACRVLISSASESR